MFVSVTRLHLRSWRFLPAFALHTYRSNQQVQRSPGFLAGQLAPEPLLGFWTITVWQDQPSMLRFRNNAAHLQAMPRLLDWCDEASYAHWQQDDAAIPSVTTVFERLRDTGKISKVRHSSPNHEAGRTVAHARPKPGATLKPPIE